MDTLKEILDTIDVESYLDREAIDYRHTRGSSGEQLNVRECPVCGGSKWKVFLNAETGLGNCFHGDCETKFNKYSFIRAHIGSPTNAKTFEHIKQVAREQGWRAPRKHSNSVNLTPAALKLPESLPFPIKGQNLSYLANRGVSVDVAQYFNLRYSHTGKFWYKADGKNRAQSYERRIIIPIFDLNGELVSFQGRDITGTAEKKYLFPPEYASTGKFLYNGHNAVGAKRIVVGEGAFDVIATKVALDEDMSLRDVVPVGTFGKHLSHGDPNGKDQLGVFIKLKEAGLEEVTIMWDGEAQATKDAVKAGLLLRQIGIKTRIALLPAGKDPNEVPGIEVRKAYWSAKPVNKSEVTKLLLALETGKLYPEKRDSDVGSE